MARVSLVIRDSDKNRIIYRHRSNFLALLVVFTAAEAPRLQEITVIFLLSSSFYQAFQSIYGKGEMKLLNRVLIIAP